MRLSYFIVIIIFHFFDVKAQKETLNWHFGASAGLNFSTSPAVSLNNSSILAARGCASISDHNGNLLFYTNGQSIWNKNNILMANGTGLLGNINATQSSIIVPKPGSNSVFYVFTVDYYNSNNGIQYSIVDMSLASGTGSVITKNVLLSAPSCEKISAVKHCNGTDIWVVIYDFGNNQFKSFLVSSSGINTTPIISAVTPTLNNSQNKVGGIKLSPNGKKIACAYYAGNVLGSFYLYDFDNSTGTISNPLLVLSDYCPWNVEFSPNGSKLFGSTLGLAPLSSPHLYQWDLCLSNSISIIQSQYSISTQNSAIQLGIDGKIYLTQGISQSMGVINNPNSYGSAINYSPNILTITTGTSNLGLPNFITSYFKGPPSAFTYSVNCQNVYFNAPLETQLGYSCTATSYSVLSTVWNFGDPQSGVNNTSLGLNPTHFYSGLGTYTTKLVLNYQCSSDTVVQVVNVSELNPALTITSPSIICKGEVASLTVSGANNYTWSIGVNTNSINFSPATNTVINVIGTNSISACSSVKSISISVNKCLEITNQNWEEIDICPNPFNEVLTINIPSGLSKNDLSCKIFNLMGESPFEAQFNSKLTKPLKIELNDLSKGIFFIQIFEGDKLILVKKIIKE